MKDMTPLQRKKGAALVLARICEAYGRMLLLEGLFQVGHLVWHHTVAGPEKVEAPPCCMALKGQPLMATGDATDQ